MLYSIFTVDIRTEHPPTYCGKDFRSGTYKLCCENVSSSVLSKPNYVQRFYTISLSYVFKQFKALLLVIFHV